MPNKYAVNVGAALFKVCCVQIKKLNIYVYYDLMVDSFSYL